MTDVLTPAKGLTQQTVGDNNNEWGYILNTTIGLIDAALGGTLVKTLTGDVTLTSTEATYTGYHFSGTLAGTATVTFPSFSGMAAIRNSTTHTISCGVAGGVFVIVPVGGCSAIWSDGTDFVNLLSPTGISLALSTLSISDTIAVGTNPSAAIGHDAGNTVISSGVPFRVPAYTVAALPVLAGANQGALALATNACNSGEAPGTGSGSLVYLSTTGTWLAAWSGLAPTV